MNALGNALWFLVKMCGRFLFGRHLNGKTYNDSSWVHRASARYRNRRPNYTWWRRKSHLERMAWRHGIMWPVVLIGLGYLLYPILTITLVACMMPGGFVVVFFKIRRLLYMPVKAHHNDGHVTQTWVMRTRTRHFIEAVTFRRVVVGLATRAEKRKRPRALPVPAEYAGAIAAELQPTPDVAAELGWQPPSELRLFMTPDDEGGDA